MGYNLNGENVSFKVTSVVGHLMEVDFVAPYKKLSAQSLNFENH